MPPIDPQNPQQQPPQPGVTPTVPVVGQAEDMIRQQATGAQRRRKTAAEQRQEALQRMAQAKNPIFRRIYYKTIQSGALTTFQYLHWKHDPYPLVLCSGIYTDGRVAGVNLHYLTFKYIRYLIQQYCGKAFSYPLIKGNTFIYNAFRTYKRDGIRTAKLLDCNFLMTVLGTVRSFKPSEVEAIRQEIQRQLRARMNQTAEEMSNEYVSSLVPNPNDPRYTDIEGYEPLERYGEPGWPRAVPPLNNPKPTVDDARYLPRNVMQPPANP